MECKKNTDIEDQENAKKIIKKNRAKKRKQVKVEKKFYCNECQLACSDKTSFERHMNSMKHKPERYVKYECVPCHYLTKGKASYGRHMRTKKHDKCVNDEEYREYLEARKTVRKQ